MNRTNFALLGILSITMSGFPWGLYFSPGEFEGGLLWLWGGVGLDMCAASFLTVALFEE